MTRQRGKTPAGRWWVRTFYGQRDGGAWDRQRKNRTPFEKQRTQPTSLLGPSRLYLLSSIRKPPPTGHCLCPACLPWHRAKAGVLTRLYLLSSPSSNKHFHWKMNPWVNGCPIIYPSYPNQQFWELLKSDTLRKTTKSPSTRNYSEIPYMGLHEFSILISV